MHEILKNVYKEEIIISQVKYISDIINVNDFKNDEFNLIASGCGTGKSTFVLEHLLKHYGTIKPIEVLFITSRSMIVDQQAQTEGVNKFDPNNKKIIQFWNSVDSEYGQLQSKGITIMTYDKIINILLKENNEDGETLSKIKLFIFDECHTLFSDLFIKDIEALKLWIRDSLYRHEKLFLGLTATPNIILYDENWGVKINQLNKEPIIRYKAKQLTCTNFETIPYLITTNKLVGKTIIMCSSIKECIKLQNEIPNAAILVSKSNVYYKKDKHMEVIRDTIVNKCTLPDTFQYPIKRDKDNFPIEYEERKLEVLISTSTLREGINLFEESGVRNVICCFQDELHITQFMGRCRYDIDNLVVANTYIRVDNFKKKNYLTQCHIKYQEFIANKCNIKWFDSIAHLVEHDCYGTKRFVLCTDERNFIDFINKKWLVPIGTSLKDIDSYKIWKDEDKENIANMAIKCKLYDLCPSKITFNRVIRTMTESLGYDISSGDKYIDNKKHAYKLVISFDEDKIDFDKPFKEGNTQ